MWRKLLIDAIVTDPTWKNGDYTEQPRGLASAIGFLMMATSVPLQWQKQFPTAQAGRCVAGRADRERSEEHRRQRHALLLSRDRRTTTRRRISSKITAPLLAINSADDFVNPPELPMMEALIKQVKRGRFILLPITDATRGHGTHRCRRSGATNW